MDKGEVVISGILPVDKSVGFTSHDVVAKVRKTLKMKKVGHAGTLDPFATGLLILLIGEGTKLSNYLMEGDKKYVAEIKLGEKTDSADLTGNIIEKQPFRHVTKDKVREVLKRFVGRSKQLPPMYSAIKVNGQTLFQLARKGVEVERKKRDIHIKSLKLVDFNLSGFTVEVECGKGTYIRTLAEDICESLQTCGHLTKLRRTYSGAFDDNSAIAIGDIADREKLLHSMISLNNSLPMMVEAVINEDNVQSIVNGSKLRAGWIKLLSAKKVKEGEKIKLTDNTGSLLSITEVNRDIEDFNEIPATCIVGKSLRVFNSCLAR